MRKKRFVAAALPTRCRTRLAKAFPKPLDVSEVSGRIFGSEKLGLAGEALNVNFVWCCLTLLRRGQASAFNARARDASALSTAEQRLD